MASRVRAARKVISARNLKSIVLNSQGQVVRDKVVCNFDRRALGV